MPESVANRTNNMHNHKDADELYQLVLSLRNDVESLRVLLNTHVHSGVTAGAANTAVPTTTLAALNTTP